MCRLKSQYSWILFHLPSRVGATVPLFSQHGAMYIMSNRDWLQLNTPLWSHIGNLNPQILTSTGVIYTHPNLYFISQYDSILHLL